MTSCDSSTRRRLLLILSGSATLSLAGCNNSGSESTPDTSSTEPAETETPTPEENQTPNPTPTSTRTPSPTPAPAQFSLTIDDAPTTIHPDEKLELPVTVENTGGQSGTTTVALETDDTDVDTVDVTLASGETSTVTFTWDPPPGTYDLTVITNEKTATHTIDVLAPAEFTLDMSTDAPVFNTETLTTDLTIENTGDVAGEIAVDITLAEFTKSQLVQVPGNETKTVSVQLDFPEVGNEKTLDPGDYELTVATEETTITKNVTLKPILEVEKEWYGDMGEMYASEVGGWITNHSDEPIEAVIVSEAHVSAFNTGEEGTYTNRKKVTIRPVELYPVFNKVLHRDIETTVEDVNSEDAGKVRIDWQASDAPELAPYERVGSGTGFKLESKDEFTCFEDFSVYNHTETETTVTYAATMPEDETSIEAGKDTVEVTLPPREGDQITFKIPTEGSGAVRVDIWMVELRDTISE